MLFAGDSILQCISLLLHIELWILRMQKKGNGMQGWLLNNRYLESSVGARNWFRMCLSVCLTPEMLRFFAWKNAFLLDFKSLTICSLWFSLIEGLRKQSKSLEFRKITILCKLLNSNLRSSQDISWYIIKGQSSKASTPCKKPVWKHAIRGFLMPYWLNHGLASIPHV